MSVIRFPQIKIKPLTDDSLIAASQLLLDCWHETYDPHLPGLFTDRHDTGHFVNYLTEKRARSWLAWYDDELVGVMVLSLNCVEELCVKPEYRRKKIGRRLIDAAVNDCMQRDYRSMQVGIEDFNGKATGFFESMGWHEVGSEYLPLQTSQPIKALVYSRSCVHL